MYKAVQFLISAGPESKYVPDVRDQMEAAAIDELKALGFRTRTSKQYGSAAPGAVISQDIEPGLSLPKKSIINLLISEGIEGLVAGS